MNEEENELVKYISIKNDKTVTAIIIESINNNKINN